MTRVDFHSNVPGKLAYACRLVRKAYGAGYYVMCGKAYEPDLIVAWPGAEISVMGAEGMVGIAAPKLITSGAVVGMARGSVIVDLAAEQGGNCPLTKPDEVVEVHGVTIMGLLNLPGRLAADATSLYARNLLNSGDRILDVFLLGKRRLR